MSAAEQFGRDVHVSAARATRPLGVEYGRVTAVQNAGGGHFVSVRVDGVRDLPELEVLRWSRGFQDELEAGTVTAGTLVELHFVEGSTPVLAFSVVEGV